MPGHECVQKTHRDNYYNCLMGLFLCEVVGVSHMFLGENSTTQYHDQCYKQKKLTITESEVLKIYGLYVRSIN